jgi:hypothetical protein
MREGEVKGVFASNDIPMIAPGSIDGIKLGFQKIPASVV